MKKISVIIPCYNVARWVDRCLTSIVRQTVGMDELEIICIDDDSTDDTWDHLQKWEKRYPEDVLLIRQEVNRRQGAARNIGLQYASGEWIAFVDADDWVEPDYFERLYMSAKRYDCDVVVCDQVKDYSEFLVYFKEIDRIVGEERYILTDIKEQRKDMLFHKLLGDGPCAKIIRKERILSDHIFFPEDMVYEDTFWSPMLHIYARGVCLVKERLYHWFINPESTSHFKDQNSCVDWLTVYLMKWTEYETRGFFQEYKEVLEIDFLYNAGMFMERLCEFERPSYSLYQLIKQIVNSKISDPGRNRYFMGFDGRLGCFLEALYAPLDRAGFQQFQQSIKQMKHILKGLQESIYEEGEAK